MCFDRRVMVPDIPKAEMHQNFPDNVRLFNKVDDIHDALASRAKEGIDIINLLNQPGPAFSHGAGGRTGSINAGTA